MVWVINAQFMNFKILYRRNYPCLFVFLFFFLIMETKVNQGHAEHLRVKMGYDGQIYVDSVGCNGGIALFWKDNSVAKMLSYSRNHIDIKVSI